MRTSRTNGRAATAIVLVATFITALLMAPAGAQDGPVDDPDKAQALAEMYAPVLVLKSQAFPCDTDGEMYAPTTVDIVLDNPEIMLREVSIGDPIVMRGATAADIFGLGEGFFLDFPGNAIEPGCLYETDFDKYSEGLPPFVYAHIARQADEPGFLALQYYTYWYFNEFNDLHESDWEGIQLLFEASTVEEALTSEPVEVAYAQHGGGETADWDSSKLERDGTHPVVYASRGSHASYYGSAVYLGRRATQGFGCDNTDGPSTRLDPEVVVLPDAVTDRNDPLAWLEFDGRWGERRAGSFNGPTGPASKTRWDQPVDWQRGLRSSSVVIPTGDSQSDKVISAFCGTAKWGSTALVRTKQSPGLAALVLLVAAGIGLWLIGRTDWSPVAATPIRRRRRAGQVFRAAGRSSRRSMRALAGFATIYVPAAVLAAVVGGIVSATPIVGQLRDHSGTGTSLIMALFAGSLINVAAFVAMNAMVAAYSDAEAPRSAMAAGRAAWSRRRPLASGLARGYLTVFVLLLSFVGIPWGIRQAVRYQFMAQAVMLEDVDGKRALERSSSLVSGRWWHTALVVGLINATMAGVGMVLALLLLLLLPSLPLWVFSGLVTLMYAVLAPMAAMAMTLLYGDAVAEQQGADRATARSI